MSTTDTPTTYTTVADHGDGFPANLIVRRTGLPIPRGMGDWIVRHNAAVHAFAMDRNGAAPAERGPLAILEGIDTFVSATIRQHGNVDPYTWDHILRPMLNAAGELLNLNLGRLEGGTLSHWIGQTAERCGYDIDSGETLDAIRARREREEPADVVTWQDTLTGEERDVYRSELAAGAYVVNPCAEPTFFVGPYRSTDAAMEAQSDELTQYEWLETVEPTCPGCGATDYQRAHGHRLNSCYSCGLAFDTPGNVRDGDLEELED